MDQKPENKNGSDDLKQQISQLNRELVDRDLKILGLIALLPEGTTCGDVQEKYQELKALQAKANTTLANNLCPDHRDKQAGKACLACEIENLKAALAPFLYRKDTPEIDDGHDPIEGLPDGHGLNFIWSMDEDGNTGCGASHVTVGQIRRARQAYGLADMIRANQAVCTSQSEQH